jgi:dienelactone hydrolase
MPSNTNIHTEAVEYAQGDNTLQGYLAYDKRVSGACPGVLVFPEWWGVNDYIKQRTRMLAELGYVAFAADMYGGGLLAANADEAAGMMNAVLSDMETGTARIRAAYQSLAGQPQVDSSRIACIGYCFGGAMALHGARIGMPFLGVVSFHGALGSFHKPAPGEVKAKILVCHGAQDAMVTDQDVGSFKEEMTDAGVDFRLIAYEGAPHGFTSREASENAKKYGLPIGYNAEADAGSWREMRAFLNAVLA